MNATAKLIIGGIALIFMIGRFATQANGHANRQADKKRQELTQRISQQTNKYRNELIGTQWSGLINIDGVDHLTEIMFESATNGTRIIYFSDSETDACSVSQDFNWNLNNPISELDRSRSLRLEILASNYSSPTCQDYLSIITKLNNPSLNRLTVKQGTGLGGVRLEGFVPKETGTTASTSSGEQEEAPPVNAVNAEEMRKLRRIEQLLQTSYSSKPGGLRNPAFKISSLTNELTINEFGREILLGMVIAVDDDYIFMTDFWEEQASVYYSSSGIWKNITYLDKNGEEKTGDLEFCFRASNDQYFWFKEL
ncbi:MAG: hypothetical protein AAFO03_01705 [Bacteroidota bacterium]